MPEKEHESIERAFAEVDTLMRQKRNDDVRTYVDNYLFENSHDLMQALAAIRAGLKTGRAKENALNFKEKHEHD